MDYQSNGVDSMRMEKPRGPPKVGWRDDFIRKFGSKWPRLA